MNQQKKSNKVPEEDTLSLQLLISLWATFSQIKRENWSVTLAYNLAFRQLNKTELLTSDTGGRLKAATQKPKTAPNPSRQAAILTKTYKGQNVTG